MTIENITRAISLILAPVVLVSGCLLFLNGVMQHYNALSDRLRAMHQERIELLRTTGEGVTGALIAIDGFTKVRIREIEPQLPNLFARYRLVRNALLLIYLSILIFVVSMFIIALAALSTSPLTAIIALGSLLTGTAIMLLSIGVMTLEAYQSHRSVVYEVEHGLGLGQEEKTRA